VDKPATKTDAGGRSDEYDRPSGNGTSGGGGFTDDDIPFAPYDERIA